jgi:hypothetical protein
METGVLDDHLSVHENEGGVVRLRAEHPDASGRRLEVPADTVGVEISFLGNDYHGPVLAEERRVKDGRQVLAKIPVEFGDENGVVKERLGKGCTMLLANAALVPHAVDARRATAADPR